MYAVASQGQEPSSMVAERFGRAPWFLIFDDNGVYSSSLENTSVSMAHGAGGQTVSLLASEGVNVVIGPQFGPNAVTSLKRGSIDAFEASAMLCSDAVKSCKEGKLKKAF